MSLGDDMSAIRSGLDGKRGDDQQRIATEGIAWLALLLRKNADYGSAVWRSPTLKPTLDSGDAILVRMSDKVDRIAALQKKPAEVNESLDDTIRDLGAYCLLWLARPKGGA